MKKLLNLSLLLLLLVIFQTGHAGWYTGTTTTYDLFNANASIDGYGPCSGISDNGCYGESSPHQTYCFNVPGGTSQIGDNLPAGDNYSAVYLSGFGPNIFSTPFVTDTTDYGYSAATPGVNIVYPASSGTMTCYYWDDVEFDEEANVIMDNQLYGINASVDVFPADSTTQQISVDFSIEVGGVPININNSSSGIDNIVFTLVFYDNTDLNHYTNSGNSAVFTSATTSDVRVGTTRTITYDIDSSDIPSFGNGFDEFLFDYKFYNSTVGDGLEVRTDFVLQDISYDVTFVGGSSYSGLAIYNPTTLPGIPAPVYGLPLYALPIYTVVNSGELSSSGFTVGMVQTGSLDFSAAGTFGNVTGNPHLYLHKTGTGSSNFVGSGSIATGSKPNITLDDGNLTDIGVFLKSGASKVLTTLFNLSSTVGSIDEVEDIRLYEFIIHEIDGKTVTYRAGVLNDSNFQTFDTLKILGISNIDDTKFKEIVNDQDRDDLQNLAGSIEKSSLKRNIRSKAINTIKLIEPIGPNTITDLSGSSGWVSSTGNGGNNLGNILYFGTGSGDNIELDNGNYDNLSTDKLEGRKTIIIRGQNLYIKSNIVNDDDDEDILGIIVLEDDDGNGGKVYIDPSVQKIDAIIYADKSIIGYNDPYYDNGDGDTIIQHEIDGHIDSTSLNNQLYIYGSVFSENTIGGSNKLTPVCPFWYTGTCSIVEAQKYDLNYLRSGTNNKYDSTYPNYPVVIKYNSLVQNSPPPLFGD